MTRLTYRVWGTGRADDWKDDGACRTADPDAFFTKNSRQVEQAQAVCRGCPVRRECGEYAIDRGEKWGVWGGMTQTELRTLRNRSRKQKRDAA